MLTIQNYFKHVKDIPLMDLPEKLKKGFLFVRDATEDHTNWKLYEKNTDIKAKIDTYLKLLSDFIKKLPEPPNVFKNEKPKKMVQAKPSKKTKTAKTDRLPNRSEAIRINYDHSKPVERISDEIKFIKRYLSYHGQVKAKATVLNFINALQRAILEKRIRKTSPYAKEIVQIQKQLVTAHSIMQSVQKFVLANSAIKRFSDIVGSTRIRTATQFLKRFVGIQGKNITKEKAKRLLDSILSALKLSKIAPSDPYYHRITKIAESLGLFIKSASNNDTLEIHQEALNGLNSALGCTDSCNCQKRSYKQNLSGLDGVENSPEVMSVEQVKAKKYNSVNLAPKWKELLGEICLPTHLFVYGSGGSGKTSFALLFTQHLASLGYNILYVAGEQFDTPPFTKLLNQLKIVAGDNYNIVGKLETLNPANFDFVVLDTKDSLDIDTKEFLSIKEQYPQQSFIIVSHGIKGGDFKGKEQWRNIVDIMVQGEHGVIRTGQDKNRWGGSGEMLIYDHPSQYEIKE